MRRKWELFIFYLPTGVLVALVAGKANKLGQGQVDFVKAKQSNLT